MSTLEEACAQLNEAQLAAMGVDGHCVVIAPPGSGKTKLLVTRLARDLADRIDPPHGAACITLTTAAAGELSSRFGALSSDQRSNLFIGTVHGFALNRIVRPHAALAGLPELQDARVLRRRESESLWAEALRQEGIVSDPLLLNTVRRLRSQFASEEQWALTGSAVRARDAYLQLQRDNHLLDFASIIEHAVTIVEAEADVRLALRAAFERIYVDEYQDLAPGLDRIVRGLCLSEEPDPSTLFAVGDADQAIYGWTGTDSRLLTNLLGQPDVTEIALQTNYRCGAVIAEISRRLFADDRPVNAARAGGSIDVLKVEGSVDGQANRIAEEVERLVESGVRPDAIGVLCRTNEIARAAAGALDNRGLDTWVREDADWESMVTNWLERACGTLLGLARGTGIGGLVDELGRIVPRLDVDTRGETTALLLSIESGMSVRQLASQLLDLLASANAEAAIVATDELTPLLDYLAANPEALTSVDDFAARQLRDGRTYVTTLSAGKGLEFDYVFIPDCDDGRIPFYRSINNHRELEEERNKFYVGLTRARLRVTLLWSGYTTDRWGRRHPCPVSRFVTQLDLT